MEKFELGPLQRLWVNTLKKYPERQLKGALGIVKSDKIRACCLGQGLLCLIEYNNTDINANIRNINKRPCIVDARSNDFHTDVSSTDLSYSFSSLGLGDAGGGFATAAVINGHRYISLGNMNDGTEDGTFTKPSLTWPEIAEYIENNPENVFTKSV